MKTLIENVILQGRPVRILLEEDRIQAVLDAGEALPAGWPDAASRIDACGTHVYPGFHDSHCHLLMTGQSLLDADLTGCRSIPEIQALLSRQPGPVIHGMGWNQEVLAEGRMPEARDLDAVSTEKPIIIERSCTHILSANTKAMELAGMKNASGIFAEDDCRPFIALLEGNEAAQVQRAVDHFLASGVTAVQLADLKEHNWRRLLPVYAEAAERIRIHHQVNITDPGEMRAFRDAFAAYRSPTHTFGPFKGFADGALGGRTAFMKHDYADDPGNRGICTMGREEMEAFIKAANGLGHPAIFHAIGDAAIQQVIDSFKAAGDPGLRNGIIHVQITDEDMLRQINDGNLQAYVQPVFKKADLPILQDRVAGALARSSYAFDCLDRISLGTDSPIEDCSPMQNLAYAICKPHALSLEQALQAYTQGSAWSAGLENDLGKIAPGYLADLVFLDGPIIEGNWPAVANTMVDGRLSHPFEEGPNLIHNV